MGEWEVRLSRSCEKQYQKLKKCGRTKPSVVDLVDLLVMELKFGPEISNWPHYGKLSKDTYHCHLNPIVYQSAKSGFSEEDQILQRITSGIASAMPELFGEVDGLLQQALIGVNLRGEPSCYYRVG